MRNKVIDLLNNNEVSPQEKFNQALLLYRNSPYPNAGLVRGYNVRGYSANRLEELLYDLKKAFDITEADLNTEKSQAKVAPKKAAAKAPEKTNTEKEKPSKPTFSKGAKGNKERKEFVAKHGLEAKSNKNVDLDEAIDAYYASDIEVVSEEAVESDSKKK